MEQLRLVAVALEMASPRHAVHILPDVMRPVRQAQDGFNIELFAPLDERLDKLVIDLRSWADALSQARAA